MTEESQATYTVPAHQVPVLAEVDVVVAGGGTAGVAAAIAAARAGANTVLIERSSILGGVATAGLMSSITNFYYTETGELVVGGIATEIVDRLAERGGTTKEWRTRSCPHFTNDPEIFKLLLVDMVEEAGARILLDTWVSNVILRDGHVAGVLVEAKGGRRAILAGATLDAMGDADLAVWAGAPCFVAKHRSSLELRMGNVDLEALYQYFIDHPEEYNTNRDIPTTLEQLTYHWRQRGLLFVPHHAGTTMRLVQDAVARGDYKTSIGVTHGMDAFGMYGMAKNRTAIINSNFQTVDHTDPWQHSRATLDAHKAVPLIVDFLQKHMPGFKDAFLIATASDLGIRRTRVLDGEYTLTDDDIIQGVRFPDAIAMAPYRHHYGERLAFLPHAADIPYRIMVPKGVDGLLVCSGKSASTKPGGLVRAQARCLQIGEAAGTAAALATQQGIELRALDMPTLQRKLLSQGVYLGDAELLRQRGLS